MAHLFEPLSIRDITLRNRIVVAPMCQFSSVNGAANEWHLVHLGARSIGGAGLIITEAAAVEARGRISATDLGIYDDAHIEPLRRITSFIHEYGAVAGVQLAHAGRKASEAPPWRDSVETDFWAPIVAPSALPFDKGSKVPLALDEAGIAEVVKSFAKGAERSLDAGFKVVEIHAAHGYLLHEFLSPLSNQRTDKYGGTYENRTRIVRETTEAIRRVWPERYPLFIRFSVTDWVEGGWDVEQSVQLAADLKPLGVDLIDCSSGALVPEAKMPIGPGYQTAFAERIRRETGILTGAVGLITSPQQADHIIRSGQADITLLGRQMLRDPYWPQRAAQELRKEIPTPQQYARAW